MVDTYGGRISSSGGTCSVWLAARVAFLWEAFYTPIKEDSQNTSGNSGLDIQALATWHLCSRTEMPPVTSVNLVDAVAYSHIP